MYLVVGDTTIESEHEKDERERVVLLSWDVFLLLLIVILGNILLFETKMLYGVKFYG